MSETSKDKEPVVITSHEDFESAQFKLIGLNYRIDEANAKRDGQIERARDVFDTISSQATTAARETTDPLEQEKAELLQACTRYLTANRSRLRRRFGKTIKSMFGTTKWDVRGATDTPGDTTAAVNFLRGRRGGKKYLRVKYELDKKALAGAPDDLRRGL
ncbi:MAG TPA: host-nuclease inhibitor Gam family protein, partial [Candidatus Saccharimonadales bacterium]|nr:host-nuclease inhibitor Gam family protein [Candidatus Saccharimonadales bacterium]